MTETAGTGTPAAGTPRRSRLLVIALAGALLLGGGSFYAVYSGLVALPFGLSPEGGAEGGAASAEGEDAPAPLRPVRAAAPPPGFVALEPLVVSLAEDAGAEHLRITLTLEVDPARLEDVERLRPRILDVLNTFLHAVDARLLAQPRSMVRLRAQMLRRVRLVAPAGAVRDLLIQEFVLN
mgnify:CR=1 FL=1